MMFLLKITAWKLPKGVTERVGDTVGLIYETNVRPKCGRKVVSTQNLEFINMDVSGGYDQISRQVWARVRKFLS